MELICGTGSSLPPDLLDALSAYRYRVFIETLGWELPAENGREQDQFDTPETAYVIARDPDTGQLRGCARLLPSTGPYLLADVFPQLLHGQPAPRHPQVWELSRFAAMDCGAPQSLAQPMELKVAEQILSGALDYARRRGVQRFITVSPLGVERLLRRVGVHAHRAGPPVRYGSHALFACWIEVDHQSIEAMQVYTPERSVVIDPAADRAGDAGRALAA